MDLDNFKSNFIKGEVISFRTFFCELIYNAINMFSEIEEYIITCSSSGIITNTLQFGLYGDGVYAKLSSKDQYCELSREDIVKLYIANRTLKPDNNKINTIIQILYFTGKHAPSITTSMTMKSNNSIINKY